jgi:hypothetical protein
MQIVGFNRIVRPRPSGQPLPVQKATPVFGAKGRSTDDFITEADLLFALRRIKAEEPDLTPWTRNEEETVDYQNLSLALVGFEAMRDSTFFKLPTMAESRRKLEEELPKFKETLKWFVQQMYSRTDLLLHSERARKACLTRLNGSWRNLKYLFGTSRKDDDLV